MYEYDNNKKGKRVFNRQCVLGQPNECVLKVPVVSFSLVKIFSYFCDASVLWLKTEVNFSKGFGDCVFIALLSGKKFAYTLLLYVLLIFMVFGRVKLQKELYT